MKNIYAPKNPGKRFLLLSLFLVLCLPLIVWQVVNENFDIRNLAFDEVEVSEEYPCVISFPNVNPSTLQVENTVRMQVQGIASGSGITSVLLTDSTGVELFKKEYEDTQREIYETFEFTPLDSKEYDIIGTLSEDSYSTACVISSSYDVKGIKAIANNNAPYFTSTPTESNPSQDIKTGVSYEYTLTAVDDEKDMINYSFSFSPGADWLKQSVINDGSNGNLKIQFKGTTNKAGSYLANVFIHDGYSRNLRSQSWIISVNPNENDIPQVIILTPWEALTIAQGTDLTVKWSATDDNHIASYQLYLTQSIQDESTWITIDNNISYKDTEYSIDTSEISAGIYRAIVKATDNQEPPLTGQGISPIIEITGEEFEMGPDDQVLLPEPQIINVSPTSEEEITNPRVTIRASLLASMNSEIDEETITFKLDNTELTADIKLNKISEKEYTLIYQTENDLSSGIHKVEISFFDTNEQFVEKSWTFTIDIPQRDPNFFYIFGFEIGKTVALIIVGGILLIILAIVTPLIIVKVWKEDEKPDNQEDVISTPTPIVNIENYVEPQREENFSAPKEIDLTPPPTQLEEVTNEQEDFEKMFSQIEGSNDEENPPEPIL